MNPKNNYNKKGKLAASLFEMSFEELDSLKHFKENIAWLEVRADAIGHHLQAQYLSDFQSKTLVYVLRSRAEGGFFEGSTEERKALLITASKHFDLIDLEGNRDLSPEILAAIPPEKRMISWHGPPCALSDLEKRLAIFQQTPAAWYRLIPQANRPADGLIPLQFLKKVNQQNVISHASGPFGQWSQIIAPYLGAPIAFGTLFQNNNSAGTFSIAQLLEDYNLLDLRPFKNLYGIVGNPVFRSRSPKMHNNVYQVLGMESLYLPFHISDFNDFWQELVDADEVEALGFSFKGFTVVSPFKEEAVHHAVKIQTPIIPNANACNVLTKQSGVWESGTTDFYGLESALEDLGLRMEGLKVAIIGCGGAGRTMAAGLKLNGAEVLLVNRSLERAEEAAELLSLPFRLLTEFSPRNFDLIINATPLGKHSNEAPFDLDLIDARTAVIDLTYSKGITALVRHCMERGNRVVSGRKILLFQVMQQFKLLTGKEMPYSMARTLSGTREEKQFINEIRITNGIKKQDHAPVQESR